ncbi:MAG: hypothetical protein HN435_16565 [Nitrospinaceae bacterium]|nr:hypothetical protein [Nitrospinaceae bacterium]
MQAKTYGLPPHLLARCTKAEFHFNEEVLHAGFARERREQTRSGMLHRSGHGHHPNRLRRK